MPHSLMDNFKKPPVRTAHASLEKVSDESPFKVRCPACPKGMLLVARNQKTFGLAREDCCVSCGQRVVYTDTDIAGMALEPERTTS